MAACAALASPQLPHSQCGVFLPEAGEIVSASETNDSCWDGSQPNMAPGTYSNDYVDTGSGSYLDEDYFRIDVQPQQTVSIKTLFDDTLADVDIFLHDSATHVPSTALHTNLNDPDPFDDCNRNGIPDAYEVAEGLSLDLNNNGIPDECELPADGFPVN